MHLKILVWVQFCKQYWKIFFIVLGFFSNKISQWSEKGFQCMLEEFSSLVWESHVIQQNFNISVQRWFPVPYYFLGVTIYIPVLKIWRFTTYWYSLHTKYLRSHMSLKKPVKSCTNWQIHRSTDFRPLLWCKGMDNGICGVLPLISRGLDKVSLTEPTPINVPSVLKHTHFFLL